MSTYAQVAASGPPQSEAEVSKKKKIWFYFVDITPTIKLLTLAVRYRRWSLPEKNVTV